VTRAAHGSRPSVNMDDDRLSGAPGSPGTAGVWGIVKPIARRMVINRRAVLADHGCGRRAVEPCAVSQRPMAAGRRSARGP
jgi:hypothetical protein